MNDIESLLLNHCNKRIALYGLGTETERFLDIYGGKVTVVGLLDSFCENGEMYGHPVIALSEVVEKHVGLIVVVARPGSCRAIKKRIGDFCKKHNIDLFDVRGTNLLDSTKISYDFSGMHGYTISSLLKKIMQADIVSFDLFDTLIARKVLSYTDVFECMDVELKSRGIYLPDFAGNRLSAEKDMSKNGAPNLCDIYSEVLKRMGGGFVSAQELAELEWEMDFKTMLPRVAVCDIFRRAVSLGKRVVIVTDTYYNIDKIKEILARFRIKGYEKLFVSCEYGTSKTLRLFDELRLSFQKFSILHIGDDEVADLDMPSRIGIDAYKIYGGAEFFYALGGMGIENHIVTLSDRVRAGLFVSRIFNNPFQFETREQRVSVLDASDIGYLFCAPIIIDFILWMKKRMKMQKIEQVLFCSRDGYLVGKLFRRLEPEIKSIYFLTSRIAAIRAGMDSKEDIAYVKSMKYSGTIEESLKTRFGIEINDLNCENWEDEIFSKADIQRDSYRKYIKKLDISNTNIAIFDFVAKGTVQMYLQKIFMKHMKGFYFLQLEPEFMKDKGLDIEPFYSDDEKNGSSIFDNYYILETVLTAPYSQVEEFGENGNPIFMKETRSEADIKCFEKMQEGIVAYFDDYLEIVSEAAREENKELDELFLSLINKVDIKDEEFLSMKVEDPFFGRMTAVKTIIE